jgi:DNA-binding HxlR family transcriptional regulator
MSYSRQVTVTCENNSSADCSVDAALSIIGGKWKLKIYKSLKKDKPLRFSVLIRELTGISEKTLTAQLREMEKDGIITRAVYPEIPPRVEYQLTDLGHSLDKVFSSLDIWGRAYIDSKALFSHMAG